MDFSEFKPPVTIEGQEVKRLAIDGVVVWEKPTSEAGVPASISLSVDNSVIMSGESATLSALVLDEDGEPCPNVSVSFSSNITNSSVYTSITNSEGLATMSYDGASVGDVCFTASIDNLESSVLVEDDLFADMTKTNKLDNYIQTIAYPSRLSAQTTFVDNSYYVELTKLSGAVSSNGISDFYIEFYETLLEDIEIEYKLKISSASTNVGAYGLRLKNDNNDIAQQIILNNQTRVYNYAESGSVVCPAINIGSVVDKWITINMKAENNTTTLTIRDSENNLLSTQSFATGYGQAVKLSAYGTPDDSSHPTNSKYYFYIKEIKVKPLVA